MRIGTSSYLFSSSIILASGLYFRERSSTLYTVITVGKVVKVSSHAVGKAVIRASISIQYQYEAVLILILNSNSVLKRY